MKSVEWEKWKNVIFSELALVEANETFIFSPAKTTKTLISTCMILQEKCNEKGEIKRYKARLVLHGFQ